MATNDILNQIQRLGREIIPADGHLYLYGSRARGNFRPDSDWDLLILLNKEEEEYSDFDNYSYPFIALGYDYGVPVSAHLYTVNQWEAMSPRRGFVRNLFFVGRGSIAFHPCRKMARTQP